MTDDDVSVFDTETVVEECTCFSGCSLCWWSGQRYITRRINRLNSETSDIFFQPVSTNPVNPPLPTES